jgi:hypothetical protein
VGRQSGAVRLTVARRSDGDTLRRVVRRARFIRTLKENLLWVRHFATSEELRQALQEFRRSYNQHWLIERHGYRSPAQVRGDFSKRIPAVA